eukprot:4677461-Lingulodinium_polyedra.AAC.1
MPRRSATLRGATRHDEARCGAPRGIIRQRMAFCGILQHYAACCDVLRHAAACYDMLRCSSAPRYSTTLCCRLRHPCGIPGAEYG